MDRQTAKILLGLESKQDPLTRADVTTAYANNIVFVHPDTVRNKSETVKAEAERKSMQLAEAKKILLADLQGTTKINHNNIKHPNKSNKNNTTNHTTNPSNTNNNETKNKQYNTNTNMNDNTSINNNTNNKTPYNASKMFTRATNLPITIYIISLVFTSFWVSLGLFIIGTIIHNLLITGLTNGSQLSIILQNIHGFFIGSLIINLVTGFPYTRLLFRIISGKTFKENVEQLSK